MFKKVVIFLMTAMVCSVASAVYSYEEANPYEFIDNLSDCVVYQMSDSTGQKQILGWRAGKCIYDERDMFYKTTRCYFSDEQIKEIAQEMKNHGYIDKEITLKYTNGDEETFDSGYASVRFWAKYLNMPGVCQKQP